MAGRISQREEPDWRPLARLMGEELVSSFMWMHEVEMPAGERFQAYKHIDTRRYLHVDLSGNAVAYVGGERYRPVALSAALEQVLRPWWEHLHASPEDVALAWAAIERAR